MKNTITELKNSIEFQKQTWPCRRKNQQCGGQDIRNYPVRGERGQKGRLKKQWRKPLRHIGNNEKKQYLHYRNSRSNCERERDRKYIQSNNGWKLLKLRESTGHLDPWGPKDSKYFEPDYSYTETHYD